MQVLGGARLHAGRALAPERQRRLDAWTAEAVVAGRGRGVGDASERLEADRALGRVRVVVGVLRVHVARTGRGPCKSSVTVGTGVVAALLMHRADVRRSLHVLKMTAPL